jgi:hypothetical protein
LALACKCRIGESDGCRMIGLCTLAIAFIIANAIIEWAYGE